MLPLYDAITIFKGPIRKIVIKIKKKKNNNNKRKKRGGPEGMIGGIVLLIIAVSSILPVLERYKFHSSFKLDQADWDKFIFFILASIF
jgi:hypothetical protein